MTTPDIAGLCEGLRSSAAAFREHTVYDSEGDPLRLTVQAAEADEAADTLERQAAEIERLRVALVGCRELFSEIRKDWSDPRSEIREGWAIIDAALTGEDK
jgi:hypothetical protein